MPLVIRHGGFADSQPRTRELRRDAEQLGAFGYMFPELVSSPKDHLNDIPSMAGRLKKLARAMIEDTHPRNDNSTIPPVYTYWGQFIDHEITAMTDVAPGKPIEQGIFVDQIRVLSQKEIVDGLHNQRQPTLSLDSVYDDGPDNDVIELYESDRIRLQVGEVDSFDRQLPNPALGRHRDLPRFTPEHQSKLEEFMADHHYKVGFARIGDSRNDENLNVAQFHVAMLKFHNAVVNWVATEEGQVGKALFARAKQLTCWHFQWLVVHDYLKTIALPPIVDRLLYAEEGLFENRLYMPLEFAVAGFRFGHSMIRPAYDYNLNFGRKRVNTQLKRATLFDLFTLTGHGGLGNKSHLPEKWVIEWDRFVDKTSPYVDRFARKIDTRITFPLSNLLDEPTARLEEQEDDDMFSFAENYNEIVLHLAMRNLLRGYQLQLPTGEAVARALDFQRLSTSELREGNSTDVNEALRRLGATPLWFYVLKEAEVQEQGNRLGEVGSYIVANTLISLLKADCTSYLRKGWTPANGVRFENGQAILSITDLFRFAGVM